MIRDREGQHFLEVHGYLRVGVISPWICVCVCIYIYIERERDMYIYIYVWVTTP